MSEARWRSCYSCRDYTEHRREMLAPLLADKAHREGRTDVIPVVDEFMLAAHERHLAGEPLRPGGPTRVTDPAIGRLAALLSPVGANLVARNPRPDPGGGTDERGGGAVSTIEWVRVRPPFGEAHEFGCCTARVGATVCGWPRREDGTCGAGHPAMPGWVAPEDRP